MGERILVTGGAGFIGSHLVDRLVKDGNDVYVIDNFVHQVHRNQLPSWLNSEVQYRNLDVCDRDNLISVMKERPVDVVYHLAAAVGNLQSQYEVGHYSQVNCGGTGNLLDAIREVNTTRRIIVAGSMSSYGEGMYEGASRFRGTAREHAGPGGWEPWSDGDDSRTGAISPVAIRESDGMIPATIYAATKAAQEHLVVLAARAMHIEASAARFFNVYGPRQTLSNPYNGICSGFMSRVKEGKPPVIFEDGNQTRDFIYIDDVIQALVRMKDSSYNEEVYNIGSGEPSSVLDVAYKVIEMSGVDISPDITNQFRPGDVRHIFAEIDVAKWALDWTPRVSLSEGLQKTWDWGNRESSVDLFDTAFSEAKKAEVI